MKKINVRHMYDLGRILHECSCFIEFIKCKACQTFYLFSATSLINLITQEHKC